MKKLILFSLLFVFLAACNGPTQMPPSAPTGLVATPNIEEGQIVLNWNDNPEAGVGYNVYRSTTAGTGAVGAALNPQPLSASQYADPTAEAGTTYYYVVTAVGTNNLESPASNEAEAALTEPGPDLDAPTNLVAAADESTISLTWNASTAEAVTGYNVYRGEAAGAGTEGELIAEGTAETTYLDEAVEAGVTYYYVVTAVDAEGNESAASNEASAALTDDGALAAPTNLVATGGEADISLTWEASASPEVVGYNIYRSDTAGTGAVGDPIAEATETTYLDEAVEAGVTYYYVVTAVDAEGNESAPSNEASASLTQDPVGPECLPRSTLSCDQVPVGLPFSLTWSSNEGGLGDANGIGTGFTMVDPPSNRLEVDLPISNPDILGYEPRNLLVNSGAGTLTITTNKGIQFRGENALVNALGVGFDASAQAHTVTTTVVNPVFPAANGFQQAGLWFGPNEDNYVKLVLVNAPGGGMARVQMLREVNGLSVGAPADEVNPPALTLEPGSTVRLIMSTNPADGTVSGAYQIGEGEVVALPANFTVPPTFFTGVPLAEGVGPVGFAGIFATHRNADTPLNFSFGEFGIE